MADDPSLESAYALETPDDSRRLYADWATTYDTGFAVEMGYRLHITVADAFRSVGGVGPVFDLGAGTGLVGEVLKVAGIGPVDATDISPEMLAQAATKGVYRDLFEGNLLDRLPVETCAYTGAVSAGTFTNGHVGPEALKEVLRVVAPGGWIVLSVNAVHWQAKGFDDALAALAPEIAERQETSVAIYEGASGPHADDTAIILALKRA